MSIITSDIRSKINIFNLMFRYFYVLIVLVSVAFSSCKQEKAEPKNELIYQPLSKEALQALPNDVKTALGVTNEKLYGQQWGSYSLLTSTGNSMAWFSTGTYAIEAKRSWYDASTVTVTGDFLNSAPVARGKVFTYKVSGGVATPMYSVSYIGNAVLPVNISGSQSAVFVFQVTTADYFRAWIRGL